MRAMHHHPIGADVEHPGIGITGDHHIGRAEVAAAIAAVPQRRGELGDVDRIPLLLVLQDRASLDEHGRLRLQVLEARPPRLDEVARPAVEREFQAQGDAPERGEHVGQQAIAGPVAAEPVEQQGRVSHLPLIEVH